MKLFDTYGGHQIEIHTPAIGDCPTKPVETRADRGLPRSTGPNEADHVCAPIGLIANAQAAWRDGGAR